MNNNISAICKKCGNPASASEFKIHIDDGIMVCPRCISNRKAHLEAVYAAKQRSETAKENARNQGPSSFQGIPIVGAVGDGPVVEKHRPAGWDAEDELLEKLMRQKTKTKLELSPIPGSRLSMCTCKKCSYQFKYDHGLNKPSVCPYCNTKIGVN